MVLEFDLTEEAKKMSKDDLIFELEATFIEEMDWLDEDRNKDIPFRGVYNELKALYEDPMMKEQDRSFLLEDAIFRLEEMYVTDVSSIFRYGMMGSTYELIGMIARDLCVNTNAIKYKIREASEENLIPERVAERLIEDVTEEEFKAIRYLIKLGEQYVKHPDVDIETAY